MKYEATITCDADDFAFDSLEIEKTGRSEVKINKKEKKIEITAPDSVALRATLNAITKLFTTYEKIKKI